MEFDHWKAQFLAGLSADQARRIAPHLVPRVASHQAQQNQSEHRLSLRAYITRVVTPTRVKTGQMMLNQYRDFLKGLAVDPHILVAIWGMETNYGAIRGDVPVFSALSSLATGPRNAFFEGELCAALNILEQGITPDQMIGSWAGAMGHMQFMPSTYIKTCENWPTPPDIWGDDPRDALTLAAQYLQGLGWDNTAPWAVQGAEQVSSPADLWAAQNHPPQSGADWTRTGVKNNLGDTLASFLLPAGHTGPAFLITANARAIFQYNRAWHYVVAVGHLADRLGGGAPLSPLGPETALRRDEMINLQTTLTHMGYDTQGTDGIWGPNTARAIAAFQGDHGMIQDGFADRAVYQAIMAKS